MPRGRGPGRKCPQCTELMFRSDEGFRRCSNCGFVGWSVTQQINPGSGKGQKCPHCQKQTLHNVGNFNDSSKIYRCSTCLYSAIGSL